MGGINRDILQAQYKINEKAMEEIDALKEERIKMMIESDKAMKEKEMLKAKLEQATAQLERMSKKAAKDNRNNPIKSNENADPNGKSANVN